MQVLRFVYHITGPDHWGGMNSSPVNEKRMYAEG